MKKRVLPAAIMVFTAVLCLSGCGKSEAFMKPYDIGSQQSEFSCFDVAASEKETPFAADLCVVSNNVMPASAAVTAECASIYCLDDNEILYAKNVHQQMNPASITKIMTAILALESGKLDDVVTITEEAMITESGATVCDLKPGDKLTLRQLLNCALVRSGNDAASAIAIYLGQTIDGFSAMMNEKAKELGATNTNFKNPHGLTEEGHYTTAYDIYLILREAAQYEEFLSIINQTGYELEYTDAEGNAKTNSFDSTNRFLNGKAEAPEGVTVMGGKTGTTNAAGSCLALLSKGKNGKLYASVILKAEGTDVVFQEMAALLSLEN
ncbi:MAG: D-alanyl-D-alanine carboxypeptidase [Lachnospiraceae bacterium]|nr:D-alanyl-D-alanine carboxypeptidase [Lachnospiraceae bacterium]